MRMTTRTWRVGEVGGPGRGLGVDSFPTGLEDTATKRGTGWQRRSSKGGSGKEGGASRVYIVCK